MKAWSRAASAVGLVLLGCGGGAQTALSPEWQDDRGRSISEVEMEVRPRQPTVPASVAVGITRTGILGLGLEDGRRWEHELELASRPVVAGRLVVAATSTSIIAFDAVTGEQRWQVPSAGYSLRGAGDDGALTALSLARSGGGSLLLTVDRQGEVSGRLETRHALGRPAVQGGLVFVPWQNQYVSAVEPESGRERGRLLLRERVSQALNIEGRLYFGELGLTRFDDRIVVATRGGAHHVRLPDRKLPGDPLWIGDGNTVLPPAAGATDRIRRYARPALSGDALGIDGDRYAASYFRLVMGLDSADGKLAWVRDLPKSVIGGAAVQGGFALCTSSGRIWLLDGNTGGGKVYATFESPLQGCVVEAGRLEARRAPVDDPLARQIGKALEVDDTELSTAQQFLLGELGAMSDGIATQVLLGLAGNPRTPPVLLDETYRLIAARRTGVEHLLRALEQHYDFLSDVTRPPPIAPIAKALAALKERRAAPLLAQHLNDPANSPSDVEQAADALADLATAEEQDELQVFFSLYRATADSEELVAATISVARTLVRLGGADNRRILREAAVDPLTRPEIRRALAEMVG